MEKKECDFLLGDVLYRESDGTILIFKSMFNGHMNYYAKITPYNHVKKRGFIRASDEFKIADASKRRLLYDALEEI